MRKGVIPVLPVLVCLLVNFALALSVAFLPFDRLLKSIYLVSIGELFLLFSYLTEPPASELLSIIVLQLCWLFALYHKNRRLTFLENQCRLMESALQKQTGLFDEIKAMALCDGLTSIANRRNFDMILKTEIKKATQNHHPLSLIIFDIDGFKGYNDHFGHLNGDKLLAKIGSLLKSKFSASVFPARYGGEEFAVIMANTDLKAAGKFAEQLRCEIQSEQLSTGATVTASFGVAAYEPLHVTAHPDAERMISVADKSLYRAKCQGKNRVIGAHII